MALFDPLPLYKFDARNAILFQINVFSIKIKKVCFARYFIKVIARPSFILYHFYSNSPPPCVIHLKTTNHYMELYNNFYIFGCVSISKEVLCKKE